MIGLSLRRLHCIDKLWDSVGVGQYRLHELWNFGSTGGMETKKIGKVVKEFEGNDICIKFVGVLALLLQRLVDNFHNEVFSRRVSRFVEGTVVSICLLLPYHLMDFHSCHTLIY